jgi:hypothetical protein
MSKLFALFAVVLAGALAAVLFFWRRSEESWGSMWSSAKDSSSSWSETAVHESGKAADRVAAAAEHATSSLFDLGDDLKGTASGAAQEAGKAADTVTAGAENATTAATNLADQVKDDPAI